jgi:hypothetical protein
MGGLQQLHLLLLISDQLDPIFFLDTDMHRRRVIWNGLTFCWDLWTLLAEQPLVVEIPGYDHIA